MAARTKTMSISTSSPISSNFEKVFRLYGQRMVYNRVTLAGAYRSSEAHCPSCPARKRVSSRFRASAPLPLRPEGPQMSHYRFLTSIALALMITLSMTALPAHGHGGGHGGGGHGGFGHGGFGYGGFGHGGFGYGGFHGFGYGGFHGFGYGFRGFGFGGFGYPFFGGWGYGGFGFSGFGFGGYGGFGGFSGACNCCYLNAYPFYGGGIYSLYGGGSVPIPVYGSSMPAIGGGDLLSMPRGVSVRPRY